MSNQPETNATTVTPPPVATPKKTNFFLPIIIVLGLCFLVFLFFQFSQSNLDLNPQSQPTPEATNSADFDQQSRLDATGASIVSNNELNSGTDQIILFGRNTCPHCQVVDAFLVQNPSIREQVTKKWLDDGQSDRNDQRDLMKAAQDCGIPEKQLGVPLLYISGPNAPTDPAQRCFTGDTPIIEYLMTNVSAQNNG